MVSSTKGSIGHLLGGAGAVEAIICLLAMREGFVPPNVPVNTPDPVCTFDLVREPREATFGLRADELLRIRRSQCHPCHEEGRMNKKKLAALAKKALKTRNVAGESEPPPRFNRLSCAVTGWGAVSPAGWSAGALREALAAQVELPVQTARRCEGAPERRFRPVPAHTSPPEWMKQPRFRRTTAVARFAVHAAAEALGEARIAAVQSGALRLGVVFCSMNGCVQFSRRFYTEVQDNPLLASPILFPETVYNAPSSHLAALVGSRDINYTLVGDSAQFIAGLDLASQWIEDGLVDAALVVAAEELDWLTEEALRLFGKRSVTGEGAAAVLLEPRTQANDTSPLLQHITRARTYGANLSRKSAAGKMQSDLASMRTSQCGAVRWHRRRVADRSPGSCGLASRGPASACRCGAPLVRASP